MRNGATAGGIHVNYEQRPFIKGIRLFYGLGGVAAAAAAFYACSSNSDPVPPSVQSYVPILDASVDSAPAPSTDAGTETMLVAQSVDTTFLFADTADSGVRSTDGTKPHVDPNLVNAWGLAFGPTGVAWVADNKTGVSTLYQTNLSMPLPTVTIPPPAGAEAGVSAAPTGLVVNPGAIPDDAGTPLSFKGDLFLFATEDGTIAGWNPVTEPFSDAGTATATREVDNSAEGSVYKGLAILPGLPRQLIVTDFHNGVVSLFDTNFNPVQVPAGKWVDPNVPAGYAPFNVVTIVSKVYVTYALQDADKQDDVAGAGKGAISVFDRDGNLDSSLVPVSSGGPLNAPWGLALAPPTWGDLGGMLVVGNFGNGAIHAFDPDSGALVGQLIDSAMGAPLAIDGLWGLQFGSTFPDAGVSRGQLYFTAGPHDEKNGLFGFLTVTP